MLLISVRVRAVRFTEIDLFGVYVAPMSMMIVAAWVVTIALRWSAARYDLLRYVWHPALLVFAVYVIVLSTIVLVAAQ
jgi:protein AaeX